MSMNFGFCYSLIQLKDIQAWGAWGLKTKNRIFFSLFSRRQQLPKKNKIYFYFFCFRVRMDAVFTASVDSKNPSAG
jgi:hypothetical protein